MKKAYIAIALAVFIAVPAAHAQQGIGVGWDNGISVKIPANPVCIQLTGTFDSRIPEDDTLDNETDVELVAYVSYPLMDVRNATLNAFGGFGLLPSTREITVGTQTYDKELGLLFRFGVEPETMVTDNIGLSGKLGFEVEVDPGYDGLDDSGETAVGTWGSVGIHWYFQ